VRVPGGCPAGGEVELARVGPSVAVSSVAANVLGAVVTYAYLEFLAPGAYIRQGPPSALWLSVVMLVAYMTLSSVVAGRLMRRVFSVPWAFEGRAPTSDERYAALAAPRLLTGLTAAIWAGAASFWGVTNAIHGYTAAAVSHVVVGILLGGLVTTTLTYLLAERRWRPVVVLALGGEPSGNRVGGIRRRLLLTWFVGSAVPLVAVGTTPFEHTGHGLVSLAVSVASLAAIGLLAGYLITATTAESVTEPLAGVRRALSAVRTGDLSASVAVNDTGEIGLLQADVNRMVAGLRERQRLQELFGRHVGAEVARQALSEEAVLGGRRREVSVLFVDLVGSTAMAASRPPDEVVTVLNRLFGCVVQAVTAEGGWVNKFEGDGALCVFGAPDEMAGHQAAALRAGRSLALMLEKARRSETGLDAGIGVATGTVVAGNVGAVDRYEYTVIGDPVNEAARLSDLAKTTPGRLLASGDTVTGAGEEAARWHQDGEVVLRGRISPTVLMEPVSAVAEEGRVLQPPATAGTIETV
jgi:adenylate cyclase